MSRKVRMQDVSAAAAWHFGIGLGTGPKSRSPRREAMARACAYAACRELGCTWNEIAEHFGRHRTTVIAGLNRGYPPDPEDVKAVLRNAKLRAHADQEVLA